MPPVLVKIDEDLPPQLKASFQEFAYQVDTVADEGLGGAIDARVFASAKEEGRFLVTADKGFGDIRVYPPGSHPGVLVLRPDEDGVRPLLELMGRVLAEYKLDHLKGCVAVATPRGLRIRRPA